MTKLDRFVSVGSLIVIGVSVSVLMTRSVAEARGQTPPSYCIQYVWGDYGCLYVSGQSAIIADNYVCDEDNQGSDCLTCKQAQNETCDFSTAQGWKLDAY